MLPRATENAVVGHIWPAGRYLTNPALEPTRRNVKENWFLRLIPRWWTPHSEISSNVKTAARVLKNKNKRE